MSHHGSFPSFLVVGAGRSGTTGLVEGLRTHPSVFVTQPKEPHYFAFAGSAPQFRGPGDDATVNQVAVTDRGAYLDLYQAKESYAAAGEGSVSTFYYHERSIPEIVSVNPQMRVVILLREPVDRAYSSYQYLRALGFEPCDGFLAAVAQEDTRRRENWQHLWHYTQMSRYSAGVSAFLDAFGADQVGVWYYDDLARDFEGTVSSVLRFIGAPPVPNEATGVPQLNVSGIPRSVRGQSLMTSATRHDVLRRVARRVTTFRMRERARRLLLRPSEADVEERRSLAPVFDSDLRRLAALLPQAGQPAWLRSHALEDSDPPEDSHPFEEQ